VGDNKNPPDHHRKVQIGGIANQLRWQRYNIWFIPDMAISDALADKKQGENERDAVEEVAAKETHMKRGR